MAEEKSEQEKMTLLNKSLNVFTKPSAAFADIKEHSDWWFPFMVMIIATIITALSTVDIQIRAQRDFINTSEMIPESKKVEMLDAMDNQGAMNRLVTPAIGGVLSVGMSYLVIAGALMLFGNFVYGGQATFKQIFALVSWGGLIGLPELIVKLPMMLINRTLQVATSPAIFFSSSESKKLLYNVLDVFDVFTIWKIIVFSIGFAIIYKFSMKKSYTAVIVLYVIYAGISISLGQLFKGVML